LTQTAFPSEAYGSFLYEIKTINDLGIDWEAYFNDKARKIMVWLDFEVIVVKAGFLVSWEPHLATKG